MRCNFFCPEGMTKLLPAVKLGAGMSWVHVVTTIRYAVCKQDRSNARK